MVAFYSDIDKSGFSMFPAVVMRDSRLTDHAKVMYCELLWFARQNKKCYPGLDRLAKNRNVSRQSVYNQIKQLKDFGLITVEQRGMGKTNVYYITPLHDVYGDENNRNRFSEEAKRVCVGIEDEVVNEVDEAKAEREYLDNLMGGNSCGYEPEYFVDESYQDRNKNAFDAMEKAKAKSKEAEIRKREVQKRKEFIAEKIKKDQTKSVSKKSRTGASSSLETRWSAGFRETMHVSVSEPWNMKEKKMIKDLVASYGHERVKNTIDYFFLHWDDLVTRMRLSEAPSVQLMYRIRKTLFVEAETGKRIGKKTLKEKLKEGEYDAVAASKAPKIGWR